MFNNLKYREDGSVARITLNRPRVLNALSVEMSDELYQAVEQVRRSHDVKVLVIEGAGGNFCTGDDLKEIRRWGDANIWFHRVRFYQDMANHLEELDKVTIAAVDGYAVGGGLEITMACDFVIATERARWGMPEVDWGITPGWGGTTRMARLIGRQLTKEINMLGALQSTQRAVEVGLWNRVVGNEKLAAETERLVEVLLSKHQQGLRQLKFIINRGVECDLYTAQGFEAMSASLSAAVNGWWEIADADKGEGLKAFEEKNELLARRRRLAEGFWSR